MEYMKGGHSTIECDCILKCVSLICSLVIENSQRNLDQLRKSCVASNLIRAAPPFQQASRHLPIQWGVKMAKEFTGTPQFVKYFGPLLDALRQLGGSGRPDEVQSVIAHNHLWKTDVKWDEHIGLIFTNTPELLKGYGDTRHRKIIDMQTRKSRALGINMFPPRIWRRDAYIAARTISRALNELESIDRNYFYLSPNHFRFQGKLLNFTDITEQLDIPADS